MGFPLPGALRCRRSPSWEFCRVGPFDVGCRLATSAAGGTYQAVDTSKRPNDPGRFVCVKLASTPAEIVRLCKEHEFTASVADLAAVQMQGDFHELQYTGWALRSPFRASPGRRSPFKTYSLACVATPLCSGDVGALIAAPYPHERLRKSDVLPLCREAFASLAMLHKRGPVPRHLLPDHVLFKRNQRNTERAFFFCFDARPEFPVGTDDRALREKYATFCPKLVRTPPEARMLAGNSGEKASATVHTKASNWYDVGVILSIAVASFSPDKPGRPHGIPDEVFEFVDCCLEANPAKRLTRVTRKRGAWLDFSLTAHVYLFVAVVPLLYLVFSFMRHHSLFLEVGFER